MAIKRSREETDIESTIAMANYLILLSSGPGLSLVSGSKARPTSSGGRVFECKTCNRQFPSFQALGGHRASHKKPKPNGPDGDHAAIIHDVSKPKTHECSICGLEFAIGQALGGHMRRHRAALTGSSHLISSADLSLSLGTSSSDNDHHVVVSSAEKSSGVSKSRKINGGDHHHGNNKRVKCLDLNLTPKESDGLFPFFVV